MSLSGEGAWWETSFLARGALVNAGCQLNNNICKWFSPFFYPLLLLKSSPFSLSWQLNAKGSIWGGKRKVEFEKKESHVAEGRSTVPLAFFFWHFVLEGASFPLSFFLFIFLSLWCCYLKSISSATVAATDVRFFFSYLVFRFLHVFLFQMHLLAALFFFPSTLLFTSSSSFALLLSSFFCLCLSRCHVLCIVYVCPLVFVLVLSSLLQKRKTYTLKLWQFVNPPTVWLVAFFFFIPLYLPLYLWRQHFTGSSPFFLLLSPVCGFLSDI